MPTLPTISRQFKHKSIAEVQSYWDARPCNIRHSAKPVGTKEYFDEVEAKKYFVEPHIPEFADFTAWQNRKVLEIGCGIGTATVGFARAGATVCAVDLSKNSVQITQQRAVIYGTEDKITCYQGDAEKLDQVIPPDQYDLIYSFGVIHHSPHPEKILQQAARFLKPGGTLKVMVYHQRSWKVLWILLSIGKGRFWRLPELRAQHSEAQTGCPITYAYTKKQARELVEHAGFHVTSITIDHIFPYRIPDYVQHRYIKEWYFRWIPAPVFRALEKKLGWHMCITATKPDAS